MTNTAVTGKKNSWLAEQLWGGLVSQIQITASQFAVASRVQYFCNLLTWTLHIKGKKYTNMYQKCMYLVVFVYNFSTKFKCLGKQKLNSKFSKLQI